MSKRQTRFNLLDTIPVCAGDVRTEWEGECAVLILPRFRKAWMQRWLLPKSLSPYVRMPLEEHGTAVWRLVDGQRTVREIIELLAPHFEGVAAIGVHPQTFWMATMRSRASKTSNVA